MLKPINRRSLVWISCVALVLAATPMVVGAQAETSFTTVSSTEGGVTVKVTPKTMDAAAGRWEFNVVLDTHSADLGDDVANIALLATADGQVFKPKSWVGAGPGGHHREGTLMFEAPSPAAKAVELRITRPQEAAPRVFRFQP